MKPPPPRSVDMNPADLSTLLETLKQELSARPETDVLGILGDGPAAYDIVT